MKVSIIIPCYNERNTIQEIIKRVRESSFGFEADREIVVVDDGSKDGTREILQGVAGIVLIPFERNQGKGVALKAGFQRATGDIVLIQDADLEYSPEDYPKLLRRFADGTADVVYGTRFKGEQRVFYIWHRLGNGLLTFLSNVFTGYNLSDMETGYKVFRKEVLDAFKDRLVSKRFGIEPELTARIAHTRNASGHPWRVYEVPIQYSGRTYEEGKKIGWRDGVKAIGAIVYFNLIDRG